MTAREIESEIMLIIEKAMVEGAAPGTVFIALANMIVYSLGHLSCDSDRKEVLHELQEGIPSMLKRANGWAADIAVISNPQ